MAGRFSVEAVFKAVDRVTAPVTRIQNRVGKMTRSMTRGFDRLNRSVSKFNQGIKRSAIAATAALAVTGAALANVIGAGVDFEQTLVNAAAKFPGEIRPGTEAFQELEAVARKTGATTEFTASQSAEALNFLAMAGFNVESAIAALPGVVDLATAASINLATASDIASDSIGAFGLATKDATQLGKNLARINDVLAKTSVTANTTIEAMFEAIKEGAPIAVTAGASVETFATLVGELANAGIKGGRAGTTLKNMFIKLAAPAAEGAKLLKRFGIQTKDANGDMRGIVDILGNLDAKLAGLGTAERSGVLEGIFGKIPLAGVNILLKSGTVRLKEYRKELEAASGASSTMASVMRDTLQGRLNALKSAVEGVKISIFSMTSGPLADAIDKTTEWVRANEQLIATNVGGFLADIITNFSEIVRVGKQVAGVIAAYMALTVVLKLAALATLAFNVVMTTFSVTLGLIKGAIIAYGLAVAAVPKILAAARVAVLALNLVFAASPIGLVVTAIAAFIALAAAVIVAWDPVTEFFKDLWSRISDVISGIGGAIQRFGAFFGFSSDDAEEGGAGGTAAPQVVSPGERVARNIEEQRSTSNAEVTIRDESGRAEVTSGVLGKGLTLQPSGAF